MRFVQFIKWWWIKHDIFDRVLGCFLVLWLIPCVISAIWIGKFALEIFLFGLIGTMVLCLVGGILYMLRSMWRTFNREVPADDVKIINRLKGVRDEDPLGGM